MSDATVTTRQMCEYIGDDSKESLDRIAQWVTRGLFELANCGPIDKFTGRGRSRRYPAVARYWCAAFRRLFDRGFSSYEITSIPTPVLFREIEEPGFLDRVATQGRPVWLSYIQAPSPVDLGPGHGGWTIADGAPSIPAAWGDWQGIIRSVDLNWLFAPGH